MKGGDIFMSKLIIEGRDLATVKNVVKAMGDYHVTELISNDSVNKVEKPIVPNTCSACPYFTDLIDRPELWGRCAKFGDAAIHRTHAFCPAYQEEINVKKVRA